ncbi:RNA polymerase sigma factor [Flavobacterium croceum]|uniref:RNA polymerase sigma-70 factor (ECF subfamily) n=1 Tax=Flavobacterium croceum DSM 17960 TaxID=1121886 RepID=A0A2S4N888_9FLAO|nr:RNA polymerase sigma factor [Flavobacterium croceum]POS01613.1 RNA polymerase sigma-70 factor (ECF subfamily) [Flavobacterium croceum DSM 17960]
MLEDKELLHLLRNEKTQNEGFKFLVQQYQRSLYYHIRTIVINHDDTDDVLQNTFIKIFKNIHSFKEESKLYSWMFRIATNEALTFLQKKAKQNTVSTEEVLQNAVNNLKADTYFEGTEIQIQLQKAIAQLPEKQQLVFKLKYFEELKYEEISEMLSTSVGALKASYHLAVKKIEDFLKTN